MSEKQENIEDFVRKVVDQSEGQIPFNEAHWQQMESLLDVEMPVVSDPGLGYYYFSNIVSLLIGVVFLWSWLIGAPVGESIVPETNNAKAVETSTEEPAGLTEPIIQPPTSEQEVVTLVEDREKREESSKNESQPQGTTQPTAGTAKANTEVADDPPVVSASTSNQLPLSDDNYSASNQELTKATSIEKKASDSMSEQEAETTAAREATQSGQIIDDLNTTLFDEEDHSVNYEQLDLISKGIDLQITLPDLPDTIGRVMVLEPDGGMKDLEEGPIINRKSRGGFSRWSVGLSLAPDLSSNEMFKYNRLGRDLGIVVDYWLTARLAVSFGAYNTSKRYLVSGEDYNSPAGFWGNVTNGELPNKIDANCRVIDIPINLKYQILSRPKFNIAASIGASSYIMLQEDYKYQLDNWESEWSTSDENKHFFGVGNLQLHFERRFRKHFAVEVAPFFKVPLTGYGHGNIRFHSMGSLFTIRKYLFAR